MQFQQAVINHLKTVEIRMLLLQIRCQSDRRAKSRNIFVEVNIVQINFPSICVFINALMIDLSNRTHFY